MRNLLDNLRKLLYNMSHESDADWRQPMSAENVLVVRSVYDNFARGDIDSVLGVLAPDVQWVEGAQEFLPHRGVHRSPAEVAGHVFGMVMERFAEFAVIPDQFYDAGDVIVVEGHAVGRTKKGVQLDAPAVWVWTVREGMVTRNRNYHDTEAWRVALEG